MRTRVFNKMTAQEIEDYLACGGDTMFIGIGVVEVHGACPIDCETILPEAMAIAMAEKADGLAMINLPYFYPGGTVISNSTVHLTILDCVDYLKKICKSLLDQGFRRIYLVNGHGPHIVTLGAFCREFFGETLIHVCNMSIIGMMVKAFGIESINMSHTRPSKIDLMTYGAYKMLNQLDYIPVDPNAERDRGERTDTEPAMRDFMKLYNKYSGYGVTAQIFSDPRQHGGGMIFKSREELERVADEGVELIYEVADKIELPEMNEALRDYQSYVQEVAVKYPRVRSKN